jgi:hypothetical protein
MDIKAVAVVVGHLVCAFHLLVVVRHAEPHHTQRVIMERLVQLALFGVELHVEQRDLAHIVGLYVLAVHRLAQ